MCVCMQQVCKYIRAGQRRLVLGYVELGRVRFGSVRSDQVRSDQGRLAEIDGQVRPINGQVRPINQDMLCEGVLGIEGYKLPGSMEAELVGVCAKTLNPKP